MNPKEPRSIWIVTKDGVPHHCAWALVKTQSETEPGRESADAALDSNQLLVWGWDATPTKWRRVPKAVLQGMRTASAQLIGRDVLVDGLVYNLDLGGRPHPLNAPSHECEPLEPDAVVDDEEALLAACEARHHDVRFIERDTKRSWRVSHDGQSEIGQEDVLISRENGQKKRTDRVTA